MNGSLFAEVSAAIIGTLIGIPAIMMFVRTLLDGRATAWNPSDIEGAMARAQAEGWLHRMLVQLDIFCNTVFLIGLPDETISTHAWRAGNEGKLWGRWVTDWLGWFQPSHGYKAACGDLERATVRVLMLKQELGIK